MKAIAADAGVPYGTVRSWNDRMLVPTRRRGRQPPDLPALNAALRTHIGHRIAALEQGLRDGDGPRDPSTVLRDLTGLKRLLDTFAIDTARAAGRTPGRTARRDVDDDGFDGEADGESPQDITAFREDIARRYAAFAAAESDRTVPEFPDGAPVEDPAR